ncbi:MAG: sugar transferase [Myxococcota bacterium]|nr:sugar transferase [Myxococcota bacterium]
MPSAPRGSVSVLVQQRVAIVHDWLTSMRGGERVVEALCGVFPQADLFTLTWNPAQLSPALARLRPTTSIIDRVARAPFASGRFRGLLPLFPLAVESFKLDGYSLVVSSSHCVAIGAIAPADALHVAYVHSTLRYVREGQCQYEACVPGRRIGRAVFRGAAHYLRRWETAAAARPDILIANSTYTRDRIRRYYRRDAAVIEPPVETQRFEDAAARAGCVSAESPFLLVSALVPNKRVDLAVRAFAGRKERLIVVGDGPERVRLVPLAGHNVTLLPRVDDAELASLYANCRALLHTGVDDFGMVMVEALAAGKPVLACAEGGALDIVRDRETGLLIEAATVESVRAALTRFDEMGAHFEPSALQRAARRFDAAHFQRRFADAVEEARTRRCDSRRTEPLPRRVAAASPTPPTPNRSRGDESMSLSAVPRRGPFFPPAGRSIKRALDVTLAASGLVLTAPLVAALGVAIRLDSDGPALFYQRRAGREQRPFTLIKLRTMDGRARVTRAGRLLRPLGLDELPQLWNVLKGDMSLIGPRPEVPERVAQFDSAVPGYSARHAMRPGITGLAQINGLRGEVSISERLRFDLQYLKEWSLALDGRILMQTFSVVLADTIRTLRS